VTSLVCRLPRIVTVSAGSAALTVRGVRLHEALVLDVARQS
jgi:hypothetical protein